MSREKIVIDSEKKKRIKCVALDLDRTTLNGKGMLSPENQKAMEHAIGQGIEIVVASGRAFRSLPDQIRQMKGIRYAITSNGAAVYDMHTETCLKSWQMTEKSVLQILEITENSQVAYECFIHGRAYGQKEYVEDPVRFGATPEAIPYIQSTRLPVGDFKNFLYKHRKELDSMDVIVPTEDRKQELWKMFQEQIPDLYITSSVTQLLELSYRECGKHSGAKYILDYLGYTREELAAFGDGDNDADLLEYAQIGFAVENASPRCLKAADVIAPHHDKDAVSWGLKYLFQQ